MNKSGLCAGIIVSLALSGSAIGQQQPSHKITKRQVDQQARIHQGVKSGELTKGETRRLERQQARIQRTKRVDKATNGGKLTPAEKAHINRMQNRASRNIYRKKHNKRAR